MPTGGLGVLNVCTAKVQAKALTQTAERLVTAGTGYPNRARS